MIREINFVIRSEQGLGRIHHVDVDETTIGRSVSNVVCLPDPSVSRRHAVVIRTPAGFLVRDLGSRNGTRVNGELRHECGLSDGTLLQIGNFSLKALFNPDAAENDAEDLEESTAVLPLSIDVKNGHHRNDVERLLTGAQRRVYDEFLNGYSEKEIAAILHLSIHTVHTHSRAIYAKFAVSSRAELLTRCLIKPTRRGPSGTESV
jgi:pSer/pThr/pTyr-binding forkhead associated (FHA) protein